MMPSDQISAICTLYGVSPFLHSVVKKGKEGAGISLTSSSHQKMYLKKKGKAINGDIP